MENKRKGFYTYADNLPLFDSLSYEERGILWTAIYHYHLGREIPEHDMDRLLTTFFEVFKNKLDADVAAHDKYIKTKSQNGKLGNLKKWNKDLYKLVKKDGLSIEEAYAIHEKKVSAETYEKYGVDTKISQSDAERRRATQDNADHRSIEQSLALNIPSNVINNDKITINKNITQQEEFKSQKINSRDYISLFQTKKWFDKFKYPRDKKAMKLWLTHLQDKGNSLKPISISSWEIQIKDIVSYCNQGYYLLDAVEFAIKNNWDTMNLGKEYSKNTKREDVVREIINKRNSLHIRLKKLAEANDPDNKPFKWEELTKEKRAEYRKRYQDAANDGHAGEMLQIAMEKAIGKDKLIGNEVTND